jgi:hypothetical protein
MAIFIPKKIKGFDSKIHNCVGSPELLPAWLHFLESRHLIDTALRVQTLRDVEDLIDPLGNVCGNFADDPAPHQALLHWRENAARVVV